MSVMYVWLPFGERLHEHHKALPSDDPAWWRHRATILRDYTLPSLACQSFKDFQIVAGIPQGADLRAEPVIQEVKRAGGRIWFHPIREQWREGQEAERTFIGKMRASDRWIVHLDADDMYAREALRLIHNQRGSPGLVAFFGDGYLLDVSANRAFVYKPGESPAPFFARWYPAGLHGCHLDAYRTRWRYTTHHHELCACPNRVRLGGGLYCVTAHGGNTTTTLTNPAISQKCGNELDANIVRKMFGCVRHRKEVLA